MSWLACLGGIAACVGLTVGSARLQAIDGGALVASVGDRVTLRGEIVSFPRRSQGRVAVVVQTPHGRLMVETAEPASELEVGAGLEASGTIRAPPDWQRDLYVRLGLARTLAATEVRPLAHRRAGLAGTVDAIRRRSESALERGTEPGAAALLRGFVLGQDDRIDEETRDRFKRSGLAHLLAVSGMNIVLLAILGTAVCALLGIPLRARLIVVLALIALYVPLTGAGASIQRAGVMGAAGIVAALAGRPSSRWYALLLAVVGTLALNPRAQSDIGWQLSFAAVLGIILFCAPLARLLAGSDPGPVRRALAEAAALTISATLATAPLTSFHFEKLSVVSLPANLLAVPAEAPVMWLGMLAAAVGQVPWLPAEPLTALGGLLASYIDQVAAWTAAPGWAQLDLGIGGLTALAAIYLALGVGLACGLRWARRRGGLRVPLPRRLSGRAAAVAALMLAAAVVAIGVRLADGGTPSPTGGLRVHVLDVGQGDAILLRPPRSPAVLIDAGPPDADIARHLDALGVEELGALVITHPDLDHVGGAAALLARVDVAEVLSARLDRETMAAARARGTSLRRISAGDRVSSGSLRLDVLWPPRERLGLGPPAEPNALSLVMVARWHGFRMLLSGDAEGEAVPVEPGDIDVLKIAHHGSDDEGLAALLARSDPELALISVGADNPYGHPTAATIATLGEASVPVLRTDTDGTIELSVARESWAIAGG